MKVTLAILTFNRAETVEKSMRHNLANAGYPIDELVWVDNGSHDGVRGFMQSLDPDVTVLNKHNLGVPKGYNQCFSMSKGELIVIVGCDRIMPDNWLATFVKYMDAISEVDVAAIYSQPFEVVSERMMGPLEESGGLSFRRGMPIGARIMRREMLDKVGYLREEFGMYGWSDVEWAHRCKRAGAFTIAIPGVTAKHMGTEGIKQFDGGDDKDYHTWKQQEVRDPKKQEVLRMCQAEGFPYYNPYGQPR